MNGRPSHEHYKIEAITHPPPKTNYIWLLTPGRVFGTLVIFCVTLCISCNFYQVYWDSGGCSSSNNNDNPDGRPLHVVLDIVSISSKLEVILRKRWQHLTEDQQQRINNFIHNVNVDGTKEILKTLGLKKEQLDMSLVEMLNEVERFQKDKLAMNDFILRKKFHLIDDDMKIVQADGIIDILHLQPQDLGVDQIVIDDIQRRSHRIMMEYNISRR